MDVTIVVIFAALLILVFSTTPVRFYKKEVYIKKFVYDLRALLENRYGTPQIYTPEQIDRIFDKNYSSKERAYVWYAYAMYSGKSHFERVCQERGEIHKFDELRSEMIKVLLEPTVKVRTSGSTGAPTVDVHSDGRSTGNGEP